MTNVYSRNMQSMIRYKKQCLFNISLYGGYLTPWKLNTNGMQTYATVTCRRLLFHISNIGQWSPNGRFTLVLAASNTSTLHCREWVDKPRSGDVILQWHIGATPNGNKYWYVATNSAVLYYLSPCFLGFRFGDGQIHNGRSLFIKMEPDL
jgi:hypothetical protein